MKLLLDTHLLIWVARDSPRLRPAARRLIETKSATLLFSVASLWEIAIKNRLEHPSFRIDPAQLRHALLDNGYAEIEITAAHAMATQGLPLLHSDPFDRLLIAQASCEGATLLTVDSRVAAYKKSVKKI